MSLTISLCEGGQLIDCVVQGRLRVIDSSNMIVNNLHVDGRVGASNKLGRKIGRNERCPCGSGAKFKHCHGVGGMGTGILSENSSGEFNDTTIVVDSSSVGVHRVNDQTNFNGLRVFVGQSEEVVRLIASVKALSNAPPEFVVDAFNEVSKSGSTEVLKYSKLRAWFAEHELDPKFWIETVVAIGSAVLGG